MTSNNDAYRVSVATAATTKTNTVAAATMTFQSTIDAAKSVVGYREGFPTGFATFQSAVNAATLALQNARAAAEMAKQSAIMVAADLIRSQGERPT
jgi:hypothetical protein